MPRRTYFNKPHGTPGHLDADHCPHLTRPQDHMNDIIDDSLSDAGIRSYDGASTVSTIYPDDSASAVASRNLRHRKMLPSSGGPKSENSVITFNSTTDSYLFQDIHGRIFSSQTDTYLLPADEPEHRRLDMQHRLLTLLQKGLYISKKLVENALREGQDVQPAVLDIGTGSGSWAADMARQFPHVDVVGVDLVPPILENINDIPSNCRFEVDDANLQLDHYNRQFNVVHMRSAESGIHNFEAFLYKVARIIRPGGLLLLVTGFGDLRGEDLEQYPLLAPGEPGFSWSQWMFDVFRNVHYDRGKYNMDYGHKCWLEQNPNYKDVVTKDFHVPVGPWKTDMSAEDVTVANLMLEDMMLIMLSFRPILAAEGLLIGDMRDAAQNAISEMQQLRVHGYIRWRFTTAVRAEGEWHERMEQPQPM